MNRGFLPQKIVSAPDQPRAVPASRALPGPIICRVVSACFAVSVLLACVPLMPLFPEPTLDAAWAYAMNQAVADQMVFGRDIIFTFGPYACAYTHQYHPATDGLMLTATALIGSAVAAGILSLASRGNAPFLLPLPVVIALIGCDALFFAASCLFLIVAVRLTLPADHRLKLPCNRRVAVSLALLSLALSLLPLVKATHGLLSVAAGGLGWLLIFRRRLRWALILGAISAAGSVSFWLLAKQPLRALPTFFVAQAPIISGYSEAMSIPGPSSDWIWYAVNATLILWFTLRHFGREGGLAGKLLCAGIALSLLLVFKASFVRHGRHALIGADFALLMAFLLSINFPYRAAAILIASCVAGWLPAIAHYWGAERGKGIVSEIAQQCESLREGVRARLVGGRALQEQFEAARTRIRQENPLPRSAGGVDIYPIRQDLVLSNGLAWSPRPIVQSYSAYEPVLAAINAKHLLRDSAPQRVFFDVSPIDGRLAALEDGASWPLLLTRYRLVARADQFLVLDRSPDVTNGPIMEDVWTGRQALGREFTLPRLAGPLWAEVDVKPTFLGRLLTTLFKSPELRILFRYEDGHTESFRYIASLGRSGFIISPVIHDAGEFAVLLAQRREQYFSGARPVSVRISGSFETRFFWRQALDVRFRRVEVPAQPLADTLAFDPWVSDPTLNDQPAGSASCSIDALNGKPVEGKPVAAKNRLFVQGWAAVSPEKGVAADNIFLRVVSDDGSWSRVARARTASRPDVKAYFNHPEMRAVGFEAALDTAELKGKCKLQVYVERDKRIFVCPNTVEILNNRE